MIRVTGLWVNKSKDGVSYFQGKLTPTLNILIFKNTKKRPGTKDPDYNLCFAPVEQQESSEPKTDEDDLPF